MFGQEPIKGVLVDLVDNSRLEFQFNPSEVDEGKDTEIASVKIPGRSHPRHQFVCGEEREIAFKLELFKLPDLKERVRWLQSLQYPTHDGSMLKKAPHKVLFVFGTLFNTTCVVKSVKVKWGDLFTPQLEPQRAEADVVLWEDVETSVGPAAVRNS
jgi:hypothetical protein